MTTQTVKRLVEGSLLTASAAIYYTAPANTKTVIRQLAVTNTDTVARTVTIHLVVSAGSASAANRIASARNLAPGETWPCAAAIGQVLEAGGTLQALASTTSVVALVASGTEVVQ